jgi:hypothetical protein
MLPKRRTFLVSYISPYDKTEWVCEVPLCRDEADARLRFADMTFGYRLLTDREEVLFHGIDCEVLRVSEVANLN